MTNFTSAVCKAIGKQPPNISDEWINNIAYKGSQRVWSYIKLAWKSNKKA